MPGEMGEIDGAGPKRRAHLSLQGDEIGMGEAFAVVEH